MRPYEVMVIFDASTEPPLIQAVVDRALETVRANGGNPGAVERWGRRQFAYEVNHKREGYYLLIEFTGEPQTVAELGRFLSLADEVMRHKIIRLRTRSPAPAGPAPPPSPARRARGVQPTATAPVEPAPEPAAS